MQFLKTLLWIVIAVSLAILSSQNWGDVSINLWGNLQVDIKLPILLLIVFLIGFLPIYFIMRGRLWSLRRKLTLAERPNVAAVPAPQPELTEDFAE